MQVLNKIVSWNFSRRYADFEQMRKSAVADQDLLRKRLLQQAAKTQYGVQHGFVDCSTYKQFTARLPLVEYDVLRPQIEQMMQGKADVLWPGFISWFAKSSGTTSEKSKYIPVSEDSLKEGHYKAGRDLYTSYFVQRPDTRILNGRSLVVGGSHRPNPEFPEVRTGDVSAVLMQNLPAWVRLWRAPQMETALLEDWELKLERMVKECLKRKITNISGVPTWTLILIRKLLERSGLSDLNELWPDLELYVHGGVGFAPYREQFKALISSSRMQYLEAYNASEGFFAFQDRLEADDMLLLSNHGIYYEFILANDPSEKAIQLADVELGKEYELVITTNAGLWRYRIGDTIRITSKMPFRIQFCGRTKHFINVFGEEVMVHNTDEALLRTCRKLNAEIEDYTVAPVFLEAGKRGGHEWAIEFRKAPEDLGGFERELDEILQSLNSDYEAKRRKDIALQSLKVRSVEKGTFYNWLASKGRLGGQNKVPRLSNERKILEEILQTVS